ncbi:SAM-dependent methyltransferase [Streptomyces sp. MNP-20]|uniref:SAM-dependent methyltransferase n=1 Tax=Streptomyces sp. MNP-20 TaxID=2721165 RepID=UPI001551B24C|nr:SAM-dependent methyltransferase [Streptomyces sp. MNP-20]
MTDGGFSAEEIDTSKPHSARMYDWFLGGKDHYLADVRAAEEIMRLFPKVRETAWANREFMHRASAFLAQRGITQFLDIGTGIPTEPNLHQVVQAITPTARVVYADNDPIVLRHAEALLQGTRQGRTAYAHADARDADAVLTFAREHLDFREPIALSLVSVLQFVNEPYDPYRVVDDLLKPLAPGSHLVLSHVTRDFEPAIWDRIDAIYRSGGTAMKARSHDEFVQFFEGLEFCDPGIEVATRWQPDSAMTIRDERVPLYAAVARKR